MLSARRFDLDFAQAGAAPRWTLLLLGLGLALLAASAWYAHGLHRQRLEVGQELLRLAGERQRHQAQTAPRATALPAAQQAQTRAAAQEAQRIVQQLHRPWLPLLDGLDRTAGRQVRLTQLAVDARFERLNLELEAASMGDVLGYTQRLAAVAQVRDARLVSFEWRQAEGRRLLARLSAELAAPPGATAARRDAAGDRAVPLAATEVR